jgi:hypothetical protein
MHRTRLSFITASQNLSTGYEKNHDKSLIIENDNKQIILITLFEIFLHVNNKNLFSPYV